MGERILKLRNIDKRFGSVVALKNVDIDVYRGEIRGLIGENGSGKSTISSIVAGMQKADEGTMEFLNKPWSPLNMIDALNNGVGMIVQESGTISGISVAENIFLAESDTFRNRFGIINRKLMNKKADEALKNIGIENIHGNTPIDCLDYQTRKLVEIAKVVNKKPDILIIDETSTALSFDGREIMYKIIKQFKENNKAVIFISHDLEEIMNVCDTLTVLRDGNIIRTFEKSEFDPPNIRVSMIGRELEGNYYRTDFEYQKIDNPALIGNNLKYKDELKNISITLNKGEILGVGGLSSCGMHALGKALFGALNLENGVVKNDKGVNIKNPNVAVKNKIGYMSKDRDVESLCLQASIKDNIAIAGMDKYAINKFLITNSKEKKYVNGLVNGLSIKCSDQNQLVSQLSGGNKQKVVFGKWIGCDSEILILDCPTRGVDIGVKQAMYQLMDGLKREGRAILLISEELPELIGMSDRLLIMKDGKIKKEFYRSESLSDKDVIEYMI